MLTVPSLQDGILLGAVGAYDWNGAVLKETSSGKVIPLRESYLQEFPEELKNHGAYLGEAAQLGSAAGICCSVIGSTNCFLSWEGLPTSGVMSVYARSLVTPAPKECPTTTASRSTNVILVQEDLRPSSPPVLTGTA